MKKSTLLSLNDVHEYFKQWRTNKSAGDTIPESLWKLVKQLLKNSAYKRTIVGRTLGISTLQLKNKFPEIFKIKKLAATQSKKSKKFFVKTPLNNLLISSPNTLTIERSNGVKLSISAPTAEQFSTLINNFME